MKNKTHLLIVFIAFVLGQAIQLFVSAIAYNLYATRPVTWNVVGALISVAIVVISFIIIQMETPPDEQKSYAEYRAKHFGANNEILVTDPDPIEFDKPIG